MPQQLNLHALALIVWCEPATRPSPDWRARVEAALDPIEVQLLGQAENPHTVTMDELPALLADLAGAPSTPVLLLHANTRLPRDSAVRLLHAAQLPAIGAVNTLDLHDFAGSDHHAPKLELLDAAVCSLGLRQVYDSRRLSFGCVLFSAPACKRLAAASTGIDARGLQRNLTTASLRVVTADHLVVDSPVRGVEPAPDPVLAGLRRRWRALPGSGANDEAVVRPGLGRRPVLLHITHSWGGGVLRWLDDICRNDRSHDHLILAAVGDWDQHDFGRCFELRLGRPGGWLLDTIPLPAPNASVSRCNAAYAGLLESIVARYAIDAVVVSSLIGHALDALRTDCPTLMVLHDFFPVCPALNIYFGEVCRDCGPQRLRKCLDENPHNRYFHDHDASGWLEVRDAFAETLRAHHITLVAPSKFVEESFRRLTPGMQDYPIEEIPHGVAQLKPLPAPGRRERLRLLVPGRLNQAKGITLLEQMLPRLTDFADVYLLGCGNQVVHRFLGRSGVHVQVNYAATDLPQLLAYIAPDAALLLSEVPETFSYVLSELNALEIPALARRRGSFGERIRSSENGLLLDDQAENWLDQLAGLAENRVPLVKMRNVLHDQESRAVTAMIADYNRLLPDRTGAAPGYKVRYAGIDTFRHSALESELEAGLGRIDAMQRALDSVRAESRQRGSWGHRLQVQLDQRTQWALSLEQESSQARQQIGNLKSELIKTENLLDERTQWAQAVSEKLEEKSRYTTFLKNQLEEQQSRLAALTEQEQRTANWASRIARERAELSRDLARVREVRDRVLNSYSWRIMRPVRVINRALRRQLFRITSALKPAFSMPGRLALSIRTRGLRGTGARLGEEFRRREDTPPSVPTAAQRVAAADAGQLDPLILPCARDTPEVSIIIPVYNQWHHTYACLESIRKHAGPVSFEVLIVDDGCTDATGEMLQCVTGIRTLVNEENLGFIETCNHGARAAHGRFLLFLNNDTAVTDGWLEALLSSFSLFDDVGLAGAKLVYPDGTLQEAGGIVFSNGSAWNYGRGMDPRASGFDFARDADYCSGACLMITRVLFNDLGGFDPHYRPAYYEDTDLAFKVRALGKRVIYQSAAEVIHYEGVSCGTDTQSGAKRFQRINQEKFRDRWRQELTAQPTALEDLDPMPDVADFDVAAAANHRYPRHALIIDATTPTPDQDSGSVRMLNLMRLLQSLGYRVSFLPDNLAWQDGYTRELQQQGIEVLCLPAITRAEDYLAQHGAGLDLVVLSRHYVASKHLGAVRRYAARASVLFDTVDLHYLRERRLAELKHDSVLHATARRTKKAELAVARGCDMTLLVSPAEVQVLAEEAPDVRAAVLSNIHVIHGCKKTFSQRKDILFIGGYQHPPNVDAVLWFVGEIWPAIRRQLPQCIFHVIGSKAPKSIRTLQAEGVQVHGFVADIEPFLDGCRLSVAPLRYGAGVKGKVNMSMSHGQPVVATPIAVEGMYVTPGCEAMVAEDPQGFARAVIQAYTDEPQWNTLSENGLKNVYQYFSHDAARAALRQILHDASGLIDEK